MCSKCIDGYEIVVTLNKGTSLNPGKKDSIDFIINDVRNFNEYVVKLFIDDIENIPRFIKSLFVLHKVINYAFEKKRDFSFDYKIKTNMFIIEITYEDEFNGFGTPLIINIPQKEIAPTELLEKRIKRLEYKNIELKKQLKDTVETQNEIINTKLQNIVLNMPTCYKKVKYNIFCKQYVYDLKKDKEFFKKYHQYDSNTSKRPSDIQKKYNETRYQWKKEDLYSFPNNFEKYLNHNKEIIIPYDNNPINPPNWHIYNQRQKFLITNIKNYISIYGQFKIDLPLYRKHLGCKTILLNRPNYTDLSYFTTDLDTFFKKGWLFEMPFKCNDFFDGRSYMVKDNKFYLLGDHPYIFGKIHIKSNNYLTMGDTSDTAVNNTEHYVYVSCHYEKINW